MDVRYINPFIESVQDLFSTMLSSQVLISKPLIKDPSQPSADVSAIIGFSGDVSGSTALCFSRQSAARIASQFAGTEITEDDPDFGDALGELANMVAGGAKARMDGLNISISLPRVVIGANHRLLGSEQSVVLVIPCDTPFGRFTVEVVMMVKKQVQEASAEVACAT